MGLAHKFPVFHSAGHIGIFAQAGYAIFFIFRKVTLVKCDAAVIFVGQYMSSDAV